MALPCTPGPAASTLMETVEGEDRRGPALDLLWISKVFTKKSSLHVIRIPAPSPPGTFSLNTHLIFCNFPHSFHTKSNIQQDKPQEGLVKVHDVAQMGATEAPGPKGARVVTLCAGKVTAGTPALGSLGNHSSGY